MRFVLLIAALFFAVPAAAQGVQQTKGNFEDKFRQLDEVLPDPSATRNASGAPGHQYWQQKVDYKITAALDESKRRLPGSEVASLSWRDLEFSCMSRISSLYVNGPNWGLQCSPEAII